MGNMNNKKIKIIFKKKIVFLIIILGCIGYIGYNEKYKLQARKYTEKTSEEIDISECYDISRKMNYISLMEVMAKEETVSFENLLPNQTQSYRIVTQSIEVTSDYQPKILFFCETVEKDEHWDIGKIVAVGIRDEDHGITKAFHGNVFCNLENSKCIYYSLDGDFFLTGRTKAKTTNRFWGENEKGRIANFIVENSGKKFFSIGYLEGRCRF